MKSKWYTVSAYWLLAIGVGTLMNILLINLFGLTMPIGSHIGWNFLFTGRQLSSGDALFSVAFAFMARFVAIPFFICFWQSFKKGGAVLLGAILYALDTVMLLFDLITFSNASLRIFLIISLCIHIIGLVFLFFGAYLGYNRSEYQNHVRTLYVGCSPLVPVNTRLTCYLNGAFMCTLTSGETKIVVIDRNHQRLSVGSSTLIPSDIVLPAGTENVSVIVSTAYTDKGASIIITSATPKA